MAVGIYRPPLSSRAAASRSSARASTTEIVKYVAKRQAELIPRTTRPPSPGLLNRELTALKTVLRYPHTNGKLAQVPKITFLAEPPPRSGFVEQPAFDAIAAHLQPGPRLAATIAFEVAWRCKSEVLTLTWNRVDLDEGRIDLDEGHSKNGRARHAYLSPGTSVMLRAQRARVETLQQELGRIIPHVFVHLEKGQWQGQRLYKFDDAWQSACRKAGYAGILIHDLRRSGVRALVRSGTPESVAMKISGHESRSIFDRYNITSDQDLKDARDRRAQFGWERHQHRSVRL